MSCKLSEPIATWGIGTLITLNLDSYKNNKWWIAYQIFKRPKFTMLSWHEKITKPIGDNNIMVLDVLELSHNDVSGTMITQCYEGEMN